ncbi:N-acetylmuramoyl-L-alanine amidase LytC precursor [Desulfosporosinus acididurans]|uniref:N-acetylmuramoyl-L-alanine amidase LytC n=1 Tax=Desulfosporosinus acididurans TaxID=476652 RepID=A0A0J1FLF1_9FIRM|nr:cell wall-binding repeat-containing protein [Desulfosporosinus acididurans]KLU64349.1 N-acetylmuramoyl-L-alanine amidase LytC precursor [Desulfosporosinus acididurans]
MKKTKKALASLAIAGMALSAVPYNAFASTTVPTRLAGTTAEQTAVAIADQTGWTGAAVLASSTSYGMVDALTAGPLATFLKAPILLQGAGNTLNADTKAELQKLNVKTVYVTSGTAVISQSVLDQLSGMGITVVSLGGNDRFETSANIAKEMVKLGASVSKVAVAYGWSNQDALSIASIASAATEPILLTEKDSVPPSVQSFLASNSNITSSDVIGGTGVISDAVKADFPNAARHFGTTAYDTNNQVIQDFSSSLKFDNVYVANGKTGIDALAGAPLAAQTNSAIVLTDGTVPAAATFVHSKLASDGVVTALGGTAVVSDNVRIGIENGTTTPAQGDLAVTSVSAISATSFQVKFSAAPADTSKVSFNVTNTGSPVTLSTTWDSTNTVATLTDSANLPEGSYSIDVKNDTTDLGTSTVAITAQKIAKITINSSKLAVTTATATNAQAGYATFTVQDQYGNDITDSYLANNITWTTGVGSITVPTHGVLKVDPGTTNLLTFSTVVITGYDSTSGVSTSATLNTSTAAGTLSGITLNKLTSANNAVLQAGDTSDIWYIDYTATDLSGNVTNDYNLVKNGLITTGNDYELTSSNPYVHAKVVQDPNDSNKAAIQVTVDSTAIQMDMPVTITAMTYGGSPSSLNLTLKKQADVNTFTIMAPTASIASGEYKQIPFVAYDQDGNQLTKYSDLSGVVFSPAYTNSSTAGAKLVENPDGTASLWYQAAANNTNQSQPGVITASVPETGKVSTITVNVQTAVKANTLSLDSSVLTSTMQAGGAEQRVDFGHKYGGLSVLDQYGRSMDFTALNKYGDGGAAYNATTNPNDRFQVVASAGAGSALELYQTYGDGSVASSASSSVVINGVGTNGKGGEGVEIKSLVPGQQNVTFNLYDVQQKDSQGNLLTNPSSPDYSKLTPIDSKSVTFSVLQNTDIKGYTIDKVANPIYTEVGGNITARDTDFEANPHVWGTTAGGGKVVLADGSIKGAYVDSSDFTVDTTNTGGITQGSLSAGNYDSVFVAAKQLDPSKTGSSANLTVTIQGADGLIHTVTTPITSTTTDPVAKSVGVSVDTTVPGVTLSADKTTATINASDLTVGEYLTRYINAAEPDIQAGANHLSTDVANGKNRAPIYFYATDSYGTKGMDLASVSLVGNSNGLDATGNTIAHTTTTNGSIAIDQYGRITSNTLQSGDYFTVTAVTTSGLVQTIKIVVQ